MKYLLNGVGRLIFSIVAGTLLLLSLHHSVYAEGTKQVRPDSTISGAQLMVDISDPNFTRFCYYTAAPNYRLYIHIKNINERILYGLKAPGSNITYNLRRPDGTYAINGATLPTSGTGYITYYKQAVVGPFAAFCGYNPLQFTADMVGDWWFEIQNVPSGTDPNFPDCARFDLWDFQVVTGAHVPALPTDTLNGRVWSQSWQMYAKLETPGHQDFNASFYVYSNDSITTKLAFSGVYLGEGTIFCNTAGCLNTGNFAIDRQSKNGTTVPAFPGIASHKVFLNNPDITVYPNGQYGQLNSVIYNNDPNAPCSWNKYFIINVNKAGKVVIKIDIPYGDPSYDVFLIADVIPGNNTIPWNGLDGHGGLVPNGTVITISVDYLNGLTNLPIWDVEGNPNGFKLYPVRPIGPGLLSPLLYWDDSQLIATGGATPCPDPPTTVNLTGCVPASSVCHDWPWMCHNKMINTWWYTGSTSSALAITFNSQPIPGITGPAPVCTNTAGCVYTTEAGNSSYSWAVSAGGTITGGGGINNNSVTVTWGAAGARTVSVTYTGTNGCPSLLTTKNVLVSSSLTASVSIAASSNPVCPGTSVTYTATPTNGGTAPSYQWKVNGVNQGTNSSTFNYTPVNGDKITCVLTSSLTCATGPATSNTITMVVNNPLPVSVSIAASATTVCAGDPVTFTATPVNGGPTPSYQWKVNGVNSGTNSPVFIFYPSDNDQITCVLTSSLWCVTGPATSNTITINVNTRPIPTLTGPTPVCAGTTGNIYTTASGYSNYVWVVSAGGSITAGGGTANRTVTVTWNTAGPQTVSVDYTNGSGCNAITPTVLNVTVNPRPVPTITGPASACTGSTGNVYTTESGMSNYTWVVSAGGTKTAGGGINNNSVTVTWTIAGARSVTVSYPNSFGCTTVIPTIYNVTVSNFLPVSISIAASANPVCAGTAVTFTATPTNGGSAPTYQWKVNGGNQGANSPTYTYTPSNGDVITCVLTSNLTCATGNPATSNTITMTVNPLLPVSVSITASANPVCTGTSVTYTAVPTNGGSTPSYQWKVNGVNQGTNSSTYTFTPINGQTIACVLISNATCPTGNPATSNIITMTVNPILPVSVSIAASANPVCAGTAVTFTATPTNGGSAPSYQWKVNGVNQGANNPAYTFTPINGQTITCVLTSNLTCVTGNPATSNTITMTVNPLPVPTISGPSPICVNTSGTVYTTQASMTNYIWSVSAGGTITAGGGTTNNTVTVTWTTSGAQTVSVNYTNSNGCTAATPTVFNLTVNPLPVPTITGPTPVCLNSTENIYTTEAGMTNYLWSVSAGGIITAGGGTSNNTVTVTWNTVGAQTVSVKYTDSNGCTAASPVVFNVTVTPNNTITLTSAVGTNAQTVCINTAITNITYATTGATGAIVTGLPAGVTGAWLVNVVTISGTPTASGTFNYTVTLTGGCGTVTATGSITVNPLPVPIITGPVTPCINSTGNVYSTQPGMTSYIWGVSAGGTVTSGGIATSNTVTVTWNTAGAQTVSVMYTNSNGCTAASPTVFNVIVNSQPSITAQPSNSSVCSGSNTSFSITGTGTGLTYQWQVNTGSGWNNVSNGGVYSGATTSTLILTGVTAGMNGYQYRCVLTGTCSPPATSNMATLTVNCVPPVITCPGNISQTSDPRLCSAALNPGFPTLVSGTPPISYTWVMTGATTGSGSGPIIPNPYTFNVGVTTITWTATNSGGFDTCIQTITVVDNQPPTFTAPLPLSFCVEKIDTAMYWDPTMDIAPDRPEYYLFKAGDTVLNLNPATFTDNCPLNCVAEIRWRISFFDGTFLPLLPSLYNTGQPSDYLTDIQLPGSVTGDVVHTITYQIVDCNGNVSLPTTINITIKPRPNVIKQ